MLVTDASWFEVVRKQNSDLWLEVRGNRDQGRRISVPTRHEEYEEDTEGKLRSLSVGDECKLTLQSNSKNAPNWRVQGIREISRNPGRDTGTAVAQSARSSGVVPPSADDSV